MAESLLTLEEIAQALRVSMSTVRRLVKDGALKAIKVRGQVRVRKEDYDDYLKRR